MTAVATSPRAPRAHAGTHAASVPAAAPLIAKQHTEIRAGSPVQHHRVVRALGEVRLSARSLGRAGDGRVAAGTLAAQITHTFEREKKESL